ncbi:MAG: hypothetical protein AB3A66_23245 [Nodularia sp. CChRGM 3473]
MKKIGIIIIAFASTVGGTAIVSSFGGIRGIGAARLYHPDVNDSASDRAAMQAINHAYQEFQSKK